MMSVRPATATRLGSELFGPFRPGVELDAGDLGQRKVFRPSRGPEPRHGAVESEELALEAVAGTELDGDSFRAPGNLGKHPPDVL